MLVLDQYQPQGLGLNILRTPCVQHGLIWDLDNKRGKNLMHLQILFNITTAVVDIWSERTDYGFLLCLNIKATTSLK